MTLPSSIGLACSVAVYLQSAAHAQCLSLNSSTDYPHAGSLTTLAWGAVRRRHPSIEAVSRPEPTFAPSPSASLLRKGDFRTLVMVGGLLTDHMTDELFAMNELGMSFDDKG